MGTEFYIIIGVIVLVVVYLIIMLNGFIKLNNKVDEAFATMDVYLKKRWDLIPNLVETVKGYAKHEKETLDSVMEARSKAEAAGTPEEKMELAAEMSVAITKLLAVAENYPDLKANTNFLELQSTLKEVEEKIAYARQFYNDAAKGYKNMVEMFPSNIVAGLFHFQSKPFFEVSEAERKVPEVKF